MTTLETRDLRTHTGNVMLDIGDGVGALIVYTGKDRHGEEIEVSPKGEARRTHTDVLERMANGHTTYAAVFAALRSGDYDVWGEGPEPVIDVTIVDGEIATLNWS